MEFEVLHQTIYRYTHPAAEAYGEARLTPPELPTQAILERELTIQPETEVTRYTDVAGNEVEFFSLPYRHRSLTVNNRLRVNTRPPELPDESLKLFVGEACRMLAASIVDIFPYLQSTPAVPPVKASSLWARRYVRLDLPLGEALLNLTRALHAFFEYQPGVTDHCTPLKEVWSQRRGVCQDFAHVMLSILRAANLPCRYVCGYIESEPSPGRGRAREGLRGALATHAWVEVLVPGSQWVAYDPTNNCICGEQHVTVSYGCDASEAAPLRGTFKGSGGQQIEAKVRMTRTTTKSREARAT